jgi:hypothetical protein
MPATHVHYIFHQLHSYLVYKTNTCCAYIIKQVAELRSFVKIWSHFFICGCCGGVTMMSIPCQCTALFWNDPFCFWTPHTARRTKQIYLKFGCTTDLYGRGNEQEYSISAKSFREVVWAKLFFCANLGSRNDIKKAVYYGNRNAHPHFFEWHTHCRNDDSWIIITRKFFHLEMVWK